MCYQRSWSPDPDEKTDGRKSFLIRREKLKLWSVSGPPRPADWTEGQDGPADHLSAHLPGRAGLLLLRRRGGLSPGPGGVPEDGGGGSLLPLGLLQLPRRVRPRPHRAGCQQTPADRARLAAVQDYFTVKTAPATSKESEEDSFEKHESLAE